MAESKHPEAGSNAEPMDSNKEDEAERSVGRWVAVGLPVTTLGIAIAVGMTSSAGSGILVAAAGALLGTIALLWASLRTLSGDAPLPSGLEELSTNREVDALAENKRRALRALKDIEGERALGRIDDADYAEFQHRYREEAKAVMRQIDENAAPRRAEAERMAREYVARHGLPGRSKGDRSNSGAKPVEAVGEGGAAKRVERVLCSACGASNEGDAAFCKNCGSGIQQSPGHSDAIA